jgi:glycosyltransferase involved in cell wall biosynthesis
MKVLVAHNSYQHAGGEDAVFDNEARLLRQSGQEIREYLDDNHRIAEFSSTRLGIETLWSRSSYKRLSAVLAEFRPDVVHFHNTFPLISPSVYYAARNHGVPVVQTLHNYRLFCPAAAFFRDGKVCEDCLDKSRWQAVRHACYRQSRSASSAVAAMLSFHHWYGTWKNLVNCYIALSEFSRAKFIEAGLPPEKIVVKPNFVLPDPGVGPESREYAVFLGRLSEEKGLRTLVQAWAHVNRNCRLRVIGEGPLLNEIRSEISRSALSHVRLDGSLSHQESLSALQGARIFILPSNCYENFPMTIAEAYACGVPVLASRLGAMQEIVHDGCTGLHFTPGDADDLAKKVEWAWAHPEEMRAMGRNARAEYELKYSAERNYNLLLAIYHQTIHRVNRLAAGHSLGQ